MILIDGLVKTTKVVHQLSSLGSQAPPPGSESIQQPSTTVKKQSTEALLEPAIEPSSSMPPDKTMLTPHLKQSVREISLANVDEVVQQCFEEIEQQTSLSSITVPEIVLEATITEE